LMHPLRGVEIIPLDHVNIKVRSGEVFGILGPNGAGKTTLIKILCTLISPTEGEAYVNGYDIVRESVLVRKSLGFITTDERSFYWRLTGRQNLEFFASLHDLYSEEAHERVNELLNIVHLSDRADDLFLSYSAGMKQKLAIARGLLNDPQVLFMDEPTRSLDPGAAQNIRDFIKKYIVRDQGKTVFISTHNLVEAEQLCKRIAICDEGKIKAMGSPDELKGGLDDGSTLHDVFLFHTGKRFEEDRTSKGTYQGRLGFRPKGGFGMRRRGF